MSIDRLKEKLAEAEKTASNLEIDEIAWLIGSFPADHWLHGNVKGQGFPRIENLLPEMQPCRTETEALLRVSGYMNNENIVGYVADSIRRAVRS
jgi:hypothetical protein